MPDQRLALHAISEAQLTLEEYLQACAQNNERVLDKLVSRLQQRSSL